MDMIRFFMALVGCAIILVFFSLMSDRCPVNNKLKGLILAAFALLAVPVLGYTNIDLIY